MLHCGSRKCGLQAGIAKPHAPACKDCGADGQDRMMWEAAEDIWQATHPPLLLSSLTPNGIKPHLVVSHRDIWCLSPMPSEPPEVVCTEPQRTFRRHCFTVSFPPRCVSHTIGTSPPPFLSSLCLSSFEEEKAVERAKEVGKPSPTTAVVKCVWFCIESGVHLCGSLILDPRSYFSGCPSSGLG